MEYSALSIFHDITNAEVDAMIQCFRMRRGEFAPGQTICVYGESGGEVDRTGGGAPPGGGGAGPV